MSDKYLWQKFEKKSTCAKFGRKSNQLFVSGSSNKRVHVWHIKEKNPVVTLLKKSSKDHTVLDVEFSPNESNVISSTSNGAINLWSLSKTDLIKTFDSEMGQSINKIKYHPFGDYFASASVDKKVKVWDSRSKKCLQRYKGHKYNISALCFTPDGRWLMSGDVSGVVKLWDLTAGKSIFEFSLHKATITSIDFHPGELVCSVSSLDNIVSLWDIDKNKKIIAVKRKSPVRTCGFSTDGSRLFLGTEKGFESVIVSPVEKKCVECSILPNWKSPCDMLVTEKDERIWCLSRTNESINVWMIALKKELKRIKEEKETVEMKKKANVEEEVDNNVKINFGKWKGKENENDRYGANDGEEEEEEVEKKVVRRRKRKRREERERKERERKEKEREKERERIERERIERERLEEEERIRKERERMIEEEEKKRIEREKRELKEKEDKERRERERKELEDMNRKRKELLDQKKEKEKEISLLKVQAKVLKGKAIKGKGRLKKIYQEKREKWKKKKLNEKQQSEGLWNLDIVSSSPIGVDEDKKDVFKVPTKVVSKVRSKKRNEKKGAYGWVKSVKSFKRRKKDEFVPSSSKRDKLIGLKISDFLKNSVSEKDDQEIIDCLMKKHHATLGVMKKRFSTYKSVKSLWFSDNINCKVEAMRKLENSKDVHSAVGIFEIIFKSDLKNVSLDIFKSMLPLQISILKSTPVRKDYVQKTVKMVLKLVESFMSIIRSNIGLMDVNGRDLNRMDRVKKCTEIRMYLLQLESAVKLIIRNNEIINPKSKVKQMKLGRKMKKEMEDLCGKISMLH